MKHSIKKSSKLFIYKIAAVALALLTAFAIARFSNTPDVNQRGIVTMIGVDHHDEGVMVSCYMIISTPGILENEFRQELTSAVGNNLFEALEKFNIAKGRKVEFSQCSLIVFGNEYCENGILDTCTTLLSSNIVSGGILLLTTGGTAFDFIKDADDLGEQTTESIAGFITRFQHTLDMPMLTLVSYLSGELSESNAGFIPIVKFNGQSDYLKSKQLILSEENKNGKNTDKKTETFAETQEQPQPVEPNTEIAPTDDNDNDDPQNIFSVNTAAVFNNGIKVGFLNQEEVLGLTLIRPESRRGRLSISDFTFEGEEPTAVFSDVRKKSVKTRTSFVDGKPKIIYNLNLTLDVKTAFSHGYIVQMGHTKKSNLYSNIETAFEAQIKEYILSTIAAQNRLDTDFINIYSRFNRTQIRKLKNNPYNDVSDFLQDLEVEINVTVKAR